MSAPRNHRPRGRAALVAGVVAGLLGLGVGGCQQPYEPNYLYRGEWIDIDGRGRSADEACGGTFAYVDSYAGALAREFGVEGHLGDYRWYSYDVLNAEQPCGSPSVACADDERTVHSPWLPHAHELVHLVEMAANGHVCADPLTEGLAEYYGYSSENAQTDDFARLVAALDDPSRDLPYADYGITGRFAAFLIERFGLDAVLEVCRATGRTPDAAELSSAMDAVLGQTSAELLADFEPELGPACNNASEYQSRVYACGVAEAAPEATALADGDFELHYALDCANERTVGPLDERVWIVERLDLDVGGDWLVWVEGEDGVDISEVELTLASCEPCALAWVFPGEFFGLVPLVAGRYWIEVNAPASFVGTVSVKISR